MFFLAPSDYKILVRHLETRYLVKYIDDVNLWLGGTVVIDLLCIVVPIVCGVLCLVFVRKMVFSVLSSFAVI